MPHNNNEFKRFLDPFGTFGLPNQNIQQPPTNQDIGTGFVVDGSGLIATNKHVVGDTNGKYKIVTSDEKVRCAENISGPCQ